MTSQSRNTEFLRQKDNLPADSTPSTADGTQGSAFLAQVNSFHYMSYIVMLIAQDVGNANNWNLNKLTIEANLQENPMKS